MKNIYRYKSFKTNRFEQVKFFAKLEDGTKLNSQTSHSSLTTFKVKGGDND